MRRPVTCRIGLMVAVGMVVAGCVGPSVEELSAVADDLAVPAGWELVDEEEEEEEEEEVVVVVVVVGDGCGDPTETCPRIVRVFAVPPDADVVQAATSMVESAGAKVTDPSAAACSPRAAPGCSVRSRRDDVAVRVPVTATSDASSTVSVRITEYVGP